MNDRSNESLIKLEPTRDVLTELFRNSAIKVLQAALELEVSDIMWVHPHSCTHGH